MNNLLISHFPEIQWRINLLFGLHLHNICHDNCGVHMARHLGAFRSQTLHT